ncbi:MAG: hypothetical protein JST16_04790 [Bdellovibrionales bacterium]|nr:hypothetical protein [Bdellovibrionales bacterium]
MKTGIVQMRSGADPWENLLQVQSFVAEAADRGCDLVCFPENVFYRGPKESAGFSRREIHLSLSTSGSLLVNSPFSAALADFVAQWPLAVSLGSVLESDGGESENLPYNAHWIVFPGGHIEAYRKIHLFDFKGDRAVYNESQDVRPGSEPHVATIQGLRVGCSVCYDLRFPELYRHLTQSLGAEMLLVPSAFTRETGRAHWHTLLRARAIENLALTAAPAQWGSHLNSAGQELHCYGHALAYNSWGELLAEAPETGDALLVIQVDAAQIAAQRARLPSWNSTKISIRR